MAGGANPAMTQAVANPFQRASAANQMALQTYANPGASAANMMNPYQQQVVDATIRDVGNAAQMGLNQIGRQAQSAGAFGGSRQAIAEAEALKGFNQQALDQVSRLNQQGYNQAMNNAFTAASGLQGAGQQAFGMGQDIQRNQLMQGAMQQDAMQRLIDAGKTQYAGYAGQPQAGLNTMMSGLTGMPNMGGTTAYQTPGLLNYLQAAASF